MGGGAILMNSMQLMIGEALIHCKLYNIGNLIGVDELLANQLSKVSPVKYLC